MYKLSVIICTYNRCNILKSCLESLFASTENRDFEVVIVDNNSIDDTRKVAEKFQEEYDNVSYYFEENQGLSIARNRGIKEAKADFVCFIDDDVKIEKGYIESVTKYFEDDKKVCGAGKIYTIWTCKKPDWFHKGFYSIIGETMYGDKQRLLADKEYPYGGNMFFKKSIFEKVGCFNKDLGLSGKKLILGEEVELCEKIKKLGYGIEYIPEAELGHMVHLEKVDKKYIEKRWENEGKSVAIWINGFNKSTILKNKIKRYMILFLRDYPMMMISKIFNKDNYFYYMCRKNRNIEIIKNLH